MRFKFAFIPMLFLILASTTFAFPAVDDTRIEKLKSQKIKVGNQSVTVEIADTPETRERGLMYRKSMPSQNGMLFVFETAQPMAFWMKNTLIPLSIGYFDEHRKLISTFEMSPGVVGELQPKTYPSNGNAQYALEMNKGWFAKHKIAIGAELSYPAKSPGN